MTTKHTPGPWVANGAEVWGTHAMRFSLTTGGTPMIATVCKHTDAERAFPYEANANLIAAAPDLLEALKQIAGSDPYHQSAAGRIARAAIARATGEQP